MLILAVDLDLAHKLLAEVAENPFKPGSLAARVAAALLIYVQYTPIVDLATLRICTQIHDEYELLLRVLLWPQLLFCLKRLVCLLH